jgi:hypothetical protein
MLTAEQRAAKNRANAQKSTGPTSAAGKARSRANATKHGQRANLLKHLIPPHSAVFCHQDRPLYFRLHEKLIATYEPHTDTEALIVKKIADAEWREATFDQLFTAFWNKQLVEKYAGRQDLGPEMSELLAQLLAYEDQANRPHVDRLHHRVKRTLQRTVAVNEQRLVNLRRNFPSNSTAIERREFDREKREFYRAHPEWSAELGPDQDPDLENDDVSLTNEAIFTNEATVFHPAASRGNLELLDE